ncbi:hypothetical protein C8Q75DRAFT_802059 [Abortiporus biennis]|nr:hypothetical protein C8Q75DRAFT_802059 [Abortiporus biennis]
MSSTGIPTTNDSTFSAQPPPSHHIHRDSEILPGARDSHTAAAPYDVETTNNDRTWKDANQQRYGAGTDTGAVMAGGQHSGNPGSSINDAHRPLDVQPAPEGGVSVGGQRDLPEGHAGFMDKVVGKTQKVAGKAMNKPQLHEKGELREAGGKDAALGQARAPHD